MILRDLSVIGGVSGVVLRDVHHPTHLPVRMAHPVRSVFSLRPLSLRSTCPGEVSLWPSRFTCKALHASSRALHTSCRALHASCRELREGVVRGCVCPINSCCVLSTPFGPLCRMLQPNVFGRVPRRFDVVVDEALFPLALPHMW